MSEKARIQQEANSAFMRWLRGEVDHVQLIRAQDGTRHVRVYNRADQGTSRERVREAQ